MRRRRHFHRGMRGYLRTHLHRRLFLWFTLSIIATGGITFFVSTMLTHLAGHRVGPPVLFVAFFVLWVAAGKVARRLARPLVEVARVAEEIGGGNLSSRVEVGCHEPDEIGIVATSINDMASRIQKQLRDQRELLAAVSHEIRTPLGHARLISELLRKDAPRPDLLDELDREIVEIDELVGELLASARLEFSALTLRPLAVRGLVERAIRRAGLPNECLQAAADLDGLAVRGDATLLARALGNLIDNAKKHGRGVDTICVQASGAEVTIAVEDRGPELSIATVSSAFETSDAPRTTSEQGSVGLGLALVGRIVQAHHGQPFVEARDGGGARIGFRLPRTEPPTRE